MLKFGHAKEVVITGLNVESHATTSKNCVQSKLVQIGPLHDALRKRLTQEMKTGVNRIRGDTVSLITNIVSSITVNVVSSCMATAINNVVIDIQNVKGTVTIENLHITQKAVATINKCIQSDSVRVGNVPLSKFIEQNEDSFDINPSTSTTATTTSSTSSTNLNALLTMRTKLIVMGLALFTIGYLIGSIIIVVKKVNCKTCGGVKSS